MCGVRIQQLCQKQLYYTLDQVLLQYISRANPWNTWWESTPGTRNADKVAVSELSTVFTLANSLRKWAKRDVVFVVCMSVRGKLELLAVEVRVRTSEIIQLVRERKERVIISTLSQWLYTYICVCVFVYVYVCMYVYTYMHICLFNILLFSLYLIFSSLLFVAHRLSLSSLTLKS